jgi:hypothetical protein
MHKNIVISQPMFLPWIGMFEQLNLCDIFVHYDDVQFPQGRSFINRVQIKTKDGIKWLTVPIDKKKSGKSINSTYISYNENWKIKHLNIINQSYTKTKYLNEVMDLVEKIYKENFETISDLNIYAMETILKYFHIKKEIYKSSDIKIDAKSSMKLLEICKYFNADSYITGLGALNYIDYKLFEDNNIKINYMDYKKTPYTQLHGEFTPYVTILDLIANEGSKGKDIINSNAIYWKDFIGENKNEK